MLELCTSNAIGDLGICRGFVIGSSDASEFYGHGLSKLICMPDGVPSSQLEAIFVKYVTDAPAIRHHAAASLFAEAMIAAFPCP
jgi:hypothetical protein